jgi:hypothetical protein
MKRLRLDELFQFEKLSVAEVIVKTHNWDGILFLVQVRMRRVVH